ncbi:unnamed protein product, partial [Rotaria sp. Silwood1]
MTRSEREYLAKRIVQHYVNISNRQKKITVNHFAQEQVPRRNIYNIIKKFEEFGIVGDQPRSGRPKKLSTRKLTELKRLTDQKTDISLRRLVPKFNVNFSTLSRNLKAMGIMYRKKKRAPKYTDKQLQEIPLRARRLYRTLLNDDFELILDDEKYFLLHNESVAANRGFYTSDPNTAPPEIKFKRSKKFEPKVLVWVAISENGISTPFFSYQQQAINQATYLNKCIKARLMPFIDNYHNKNKVLFW